LALNTVVRVLTTIVVKFEMFGEAVIKVVRVAGGVGGCVRY